MQTRPPMLMTATLDESPFSGPITTGPLLPTSSFSGPFVIEPFVASAHTALPAEVPPPAPRAPVTTSITAVNLDESGSSWSLEPNLRDRGPAYAVMQKCLAMQETATPRGRLARVFGRSPLHPEARSWYRGALGEIVVANVLAQLGPEWTVLHAVPVGSGASDIDHVILGPGGIFTINTKNHSGKKIWIGGGTFLVNGYKQDYMRNSFHEAERAAKLLSDVTGRPVTVTPLIVVVNPASITTGRKRPRVTVLSSNTLKRWLVRRPRVLSDRAVVHFSMFAEEPSTWHAGPVVADDPTRHVQGFERLRIDVDAARQRAHLWLLGLGVAIILVAPLAVAQVFRLLEPMLAVPGQ